MTKSDLIARVGAHWPQLVARDIEVVVKTILDAIAQRLAKGQRIEIRGFGSFSSFSLNYRPARTGRNPKSGEKVHVPETFTPHFKAGRELRERVDKPAGGPGLYGRRDRRQCELQQYLAQRLPDLAHSTQSGWATCWLNCPTPNHAPLLYRDVNDDVMSDEL